MAKVKIASSTTSLLDMLDDKQDREYKISLPGYAFLDYIIVNAEDEDAAITAAQQRVDQWRFKVQRERGRLVIRIQPPR
jgi:hypothetical protein